MHTRGRSLGENRHKNRFIPVSYIDDVNSVRVGKKEPMDEALEEATSKYRLKWDRSKDWKNEVHLGVNLNGKKHWKFRTGRAEAAFNTIRRLTRLPPEEKRKVVIGQLLPILTYGAELYTTPSEEGSRLAARMARWVVMGYKGSSRRKVEEICGIGQLGKKRIRWAASVYARNEPELRARARRILEEELGEEARLIWMEGVKPGKTTRAAEAREDLEGSLARGELVGYTDGSRMEGVAAGASAEGGIFLGSYATVMDAEMIGIAGAWEEGYTVVATDSQAAVKRCVKLTAGIQRGESWIDERVIRAAEGREGSKLGLIWVKGHSGVEGNELADRRAKEKVMEGIWNSGQNLATPAGIRQAYPLYHGEPHMKWDKDELRSLTYLHTDKGPPKAWLHKIGKADDPWCVCGEAQNAAHLMISRCVGGAKRKWEDIWTDRVFCGEVTRFLRAGGGGGDGDEGG